MGIVVRNIVLFMLFLAIQYQLWFSPYGVALARGLKEEIVFLASQYSRMQRRIEDMSPAKVAGAREELIEDQAREVYHYVAEGETFIPFTDVLKNTV